MEMASVLWGIPLALWRLFSTLGDNISTVKDSVSTVEGIQYMQGDAFSTCRVIASVEWRDNISTVEGIQYSGGRFLILACLVIKNDEKILIFLCITKRNFHSEVSKILADFMPLKVNCKGFTS